METKKATIVLNTLFRVIIALGCIILLGILLFKLYGLFIKDTEAEQARETLRQMTEMINHLEEGEIKDYLYVAPKDWVLVSDNEELYLCRLDNLDVDIGTGTEKAEIVQKCFDGGIFEKLRFNVKVNHVCRRNLVEGCLVVDEIPLLLYFEKNDEKVNIASQAGVGGQTSFDDILELKSSSGKTIKELAMEYAVSEEKSISEEIKKIIKDYFSNLDSKKEYNIEKENLVWEFYLAKKIVVGGGDVYMNILNVESHLDYEISGGGALFSKSFDFEKNGDFKIRFKLYDKSKIIFTKPSLII